MYELFFEQNILQTIKYQFFIRVITLTFICALNRKALVFPQN
jgi:hypothetical protein